MIAPFPWSMVPAGAALHRVGASVTAADGSIVASCLGSRNGEIRGPAVTERRNANARMIASTGALVALARRVAADDKQPREIRRQALEALRDGGLAF